MVKEELKLSSRGQALFDKAVIQTKEEIEKFGRVRTRFYYPNGELLLRAELDNLLKEFQLDSPFINRDSQYLSFLNQRVFETMQIKIHRLSPDYYIIVTQPKGKPLTFLIRDVEASQEQNLEVVWEGVEFSEAKIRSAEIHLTADLIGD